MSADRVAKGYIISVGELAGQLPKYARRETFCYEYCKPMIQLTKRNGQGKNIVALKKLLPNLIL